MGCYLEARSHRLGVHGGEEGRNKHTPWYKSMTYAAAYLASTQAGRWTAQSQGQTPIFHVCLFNLLPDCP